MRSITSEKGLAAFLSALVVYWLMLGPSKLSAQVSSQDSLALVALYNATNGASWTDGTNWLTANPVSTWNGIILTANRVTSIDLVGNNLSGQLPAEIGNLDALDFLRIANTPLGGILPDEIGNLTNLTNLQMFGCQLTGGIPDTIYSLTNLTYLNFNNNSLTGSISSRIGDLSLLSVLVLSNNSLSGTWPSELWGLTNLSNLTLGGNDLTGSISPAIGNLTNLVTLWIDRNEFFGPIPVEIGNLSSLTLIRVRENQFSGDFPDTVRSMTSLQNINAEDNLFTGLPDLSPLASLNNLTIENNRLTFGDIEPNIGVPTFTFSYAPQDSVGSSLDTILSSRFKHHTFGLRWRQFKPISSGTRIVY